MSGIVQTGGRLTIRGLREQLAKIDGPQFRNDLAEVCAEAAGKFISDGFRRSRDPYGDSWEPLKSRSGQPLLLTGRLRASFATTVVPGGFRIDATAQYAIFHQYGTKPGKRRARLQPVRGGRFARRRSFDKQRRGAVALRFIPSGFSGGIPARPMVPTPEQGGLPYLWQKKFGQEAKDLIRRSLGEQS